MVGKYGGNKGKTFSSLKVKLEYTLYDESIYEFDERSGLH